MPKLPNVTREELKLLANVCEDPAMGALDLHDRLQKSYVDDGAVTLRLTADILRASRALSDLAGQMLYRLVRDHDAAETEAEIRALIAQRENAK